MGEVEGTQALHASQAKACTYPFLLPWLAAVRGCSWALPL